MRVYQVIQHEYNSDDGHYDEHPESEYVYADEAGAIKRRDALNLVELAQREKYVHMEIDRRTKEWEAAGRPKRVMVKSMWGDHLSPYCTAGIENYKAENIFTADPTDIDAIERFANRQNCLTYFTVETLGVLK